MHASAADAPVARPALGLSLPTVRSSSSEQRARPLAASLVALSADRDCRCSVDFPDECSVEIMYEFYLKQRKWQHNILKLIHKAR